MLPEDERILGITDDPEWGVITAHGLVAIVTNVAIRHGRKPIANVCCLSAPEHDVIRQSRKASPYMAPSYRYLFAACLE
jgi:hypothetical protein